MSSPQIQLLTASKLKTIDPEYDVQKQTLAFAKRSDTVTLSNNNTTASWTEAAQLSWVPVPSQTQFTNAKKVSWDFEFSHKKRQIGFGFMLCFLVTDPKTQNSKIDVDWGFFGYLGSSPNAWSYDPTTGDVVTDTESIEGGLPTFEDQGVVSVECVWEKEGAWARFVMEGKASEKIQLPPEAVVRPAACFLKVGQVVTMKNLKVEVE